MLGSSVVMHVSPVGTSQAYVPVFMSVFLSSCQRLFLAIICVAVIARSAYGSRLQDQIPWVAV